jgi:hypothetical protein
MTSLVTLARAIIDMRKHPLKTNARERYPAAAAQFAQAVAACDDPVRLRAVIRADTGHVLPPPVKQQVYEKLLAMDDQRTPDVLRAYAMHLTMFGYTDADGALIHDVDDQINALFAEADAHPSDPLE